MKQENKKPVLILSLIMIVSIFSISAIAEEVTLPNIKEDVMPAAVYKCEITENGVNIRSGPGLEYTSYGHLNKGDIVYEHRGPFVDSDGREWMYVLRNDNGKYGYVAREFLRQVPDF